VSPQATEEVSYRFAVRSEGCESGTNGTPKSFPLRGRCRRRRRKRCRTKKHSVPSDTQAERKSPLPSSGLRETPDATLPSRGGIFARSPFRGMRKRNEWHPEVLPLEGKVSPQATEEVSYRIAVRSDGCENGTNGTPKSFPLRGRCRRRRRKRCRTESQSVPRDAKAERMAPRSPSPRGEGVAAGDGRGVVPKSIPFRRMHKRNEDHLFRHPACVGRRMPPSPQGEGFLRAVRSDGCENGTNGTPKSFPSRGRCRRRRRKRCRPKSQSVPRDAKAERRSPLPSSGLRGTPDATLPSRGGILRAVRSDGCESGTNGTPKSFPLRGRCRRRRRKRCRTKKQSVPSDAQAERRSPLPSSGLRGTPDATLPSRGGILRAARFDGRKNGTSSTQSFPSRGRCRRRRRKRCRIKKHSVPSDAQAERKPPLPSSGLRGTPDATLPSRGGILRVGQSRPPDEPSRWLHPQG